MKISDLPHFNFKNKMVFLLLLLIIWLPACQPGDSLSPTQTPPLGTSIPPSDLPGAPTEPELLSVNQPTLAPISTPVIENLGDDTPLRITFPTPAGAPVSLWRAPLYDAPFALGLYDHFYFVRPIAADNVNWPLANYRYGGVYFGPDVVHTGIDIPAPKYTPVHAAGPGKVTWADYGISHGDDDPKDPYGLAVKIQHDFGFQGRRLSTVYAHLDRVYVYAGQRVETGDIIGVIGTTGATTGPHLHFEVRLESSTYYTTRNPELWLAPPQGTGVLAGRLYNTNGSILDGQAVTIRSIKTGQRWTAFAYGNRSVPGDDYYNENVALSDLPAGDYLVWIDYLEDTFITNLTIYPGTVTFFTFHGKYGFSVGLPPARLPVGWLPE